ncbi:helix-turn-helix domain-containing protein [Streptomyces sp. NPDC051940]|uniref:ArsR/SmtB family transcription factor n=1 Tax=Streptomyces sp. NPDC051940 TaxID=3155675 RepID=UPI0034282CDC
MSTHTHHLHPVAKTTVRFRLGLADLAATSFACSALQETVLSLRMWGESAQFAEQLPWFDRIRPEFQALRHRDLLLALASRHHYLPDFLTPRPATAWPDVAKELAAVRATPPELVRPDLERTFLPREGALPELLETGLSDPVALLGRIADGLQEYWDRCLAPGWWPRARSVLQADLVHRARRLAECGADGLFADLDHRVSWHDGVLTLRFGGPAGPGTDVEVAGRGLVLVPTLFARAANTLITPGPAPVLLYPARGRATMGESPDPPPTTQALRRLLGAPRARLLGLLAEPASTTELARRLDVTPSAVSQHLAVLRGARLVNRARHGGVVLYARSALGEELCA